MEAIKELITIAGAVLGIIVTATGFLIPLVKNAKAKKALEQLNALTKVIQPYIVEAEQFANYSGTEKKQYVMTKVNSFALENGIAFNAERTSQLIEEIVATTKQVNKRAKDSGKIEAAAGSATTAIAASISDAVVKKY